MNEDKAALNFRVMTDTVDHYTSDPDLIQAVQFSVDHEKIYWGDAPIKKQSRPNSDHKTKITVLSCDTLAAAALHKGEKIAVLDFANNHHAGGSPFTAGAQEECLCRMTTLFPCLEAKQKEFYAKHKTDYREGRLDDYGNDDAIFVPDVVVFKSSESEPKILSKEQRFQVDMIVMAAPELGFGESLNEQKLDSVLRQRIERIFDIAQAEGDRVLILGAFGCGAFHNPPEMVARIMKEFAEKSDFDEVDFAIKSWRDGDPNLVAFKSI